MRNLLKTLKWMLGRSRAFIFPICTIIALEIVLSLIGVLVAIMSKKLIDSATGNKATVIYFALLLFGIVLIQIVLRARNTILYTSTMEKLSNNIRKYLFERLSRIEWLEINKYHSGDVLTRMTSDIETVTRGLVYMIPYIVSYGVSFISAFITLIVLDPVLAILAFILGPVTLLLSRAFAKKLKALHIKIQESESSYRSYLQESIVNVLIVKVFGLERMTTERIDELQKTRLDFILKRTRISAFSSSLLSGGYWAGYLLALVWGTFRLSVGAITFGTIAAFLQLVEQVQGPFVNLAYTFPQVIASIASAGRLMEFESLQLEDFGDNVIQIENPGFLFKNVSFSYEKDKPVLSELNMAIPSGEITAIIGPSGEGKTTLVRLLLRLVKPVSGKIFLTDKKGDRFEVTAGSRSLISYVPQGNTLFSGSVAENLRLGCSEASVDDMIEAAKAACAYDFIMDLPDGLNTKIGEKGLGLSEGQAQRLAIARALLRKTPILILDEATSALDTVTESHVLKSVMDLEPQRTCIMITHRSSALKFCQNIFRIENNNIIRYTQTEDIVD